MNKRNRQEMDPMQAAQAALEEMIDAGKSGDVVDQETDAPFKPDPPIVADDGGWEDIAADPLDAYEHGQQFEVMLGDVPVQARFVVTRHVVNYRWTKGWLFRAVATNERIDGVKKLRKSFGPMVV